MGDKANGRKAKRYYTMNTRRKTDRGKTKKKDAAAKCLWGTAQPYFPA